MNLKTLAFVVSRNFDAALERSYFGVITLFCAYLWRNEGLRPRGSSKAQSPIAVALGVAAISLSQERGHVKPKKKADWI